MTARESRSPGAPGIRDQRVYGDEDAALAGESTQAEEDTEGLDKKEVWIIVMGKVETIYHRGRGK